MSMDLARKDFGTEPQYFIAGTGIGITTAVKPAGADLEARAPVILSGGKVTAASKTALTGLYGITADSAKKDEDAVIYLTGEFFADCLVLPEGTTAEDLETPLRNIGIFLKDGGTPASDGRGDVDDDV